MEQLDVDLKVRGTVDSTSISKLVLLIEIVIPIILIIGGVLLDDFSDYGLILLLILLMTYLINRILQRVKGIRISTNSIVFQKFFSEIHWDFSNISKLKLNAFSDYRTLDLEFKMNDGSKIDIRIVSENVHDFEQHISFFRQNLKNVEVN